MARSTLRRRAALAAVATGASLSLAPSALATFPGDNGAIAFTRGGDIFTINPDGTGERQLTSGPATDLAPEWTPDGRQVFFNRNGAIHRMNADGSGVSAVGIDGFGPQISADGKRLAYAQGEEVRIADLDGSNDEQLESLVFLSSVDDWAPTHSLLLITVSDGDDQFFARSPAGVTVGFGLHDDRHLNNHQPSFSPDGSKIAWVSSFSPVTGCPDEGCPPDPDVGLRTMDIGAGDKRTIHDRGTQPAWSPDGRRIVYVNGDTLQVIRADGSGRKTLAKGTQPDWQPVSPKPPEPKVIHVPGPERVVTVPVEVKVPGPVRVVEKVVARTVQGPGGTCVIPAGKRKLTLLIRATRAIKAGAGVKIEVELANGEARAKVPRGKPIRAAVRSDGT